MKVAISHLGAEDEQRFPCAQQAMEQLTENTNMVEVLTGAVPNGRLHMVMPFSPQGSIDNLITSNRPLGLQETLRIGVRLAGGLEPAHRLGIIHRDTKPANILITDYGEPTLTDFGITRVPGFQRRNGQIAASPAFVAANIHAGSAASTAADAYSLGATLLAPITGQAAFERHSGEHVIAQFERFTIHPIPISRNAESVGYLGGRCGCHVTRPHKATLLRRVRRTTQPLEVAARIHRDHSDGSPVAVGKPSIGIHARSSSLPVGGDIR